MTKKNFKNTAIQLRKAGNSYSEILKNISVSKSTLSLWLRSVDLSKKQKQRITLKKLQAAWRGGEVKKRNRIEKSEKIIKQAKMEVKKITNKDLCLLGTMLYWAEGSKEKKYNPGTGVIFGNSDPLMIKIYLKWLKDCLLITEDRLTFEIYIHETYNCDIENLRNFWSKQTGFPINLFKRVYFKKNKISKNSKKRKVPYYGLLRVIVKRSSSLNRKIAGWIEGVCYQCGIV